MPLADAAPMYTRSLLQGEQARVSYLSGRVRKVTSSAEARRRLLSALGGAAFQSSLSRACRTHVYVVVHGFSAS